MGGLSRRGLFGALFAAPLAVAAGMPLADKLGWWSVLRSYAWGISPALNVTIIESDDDQGQPGKWEMQGDMEGWQKWLDEHPFGRYRTEAGQTMGRAKHALLDRDLMREHGLPEYQDSEDIMPYMRKALEDAKLYVFPPEQSYGERVAREYYEW